MQRLLVLVVIVGITAACSDTADLVPAPTAATPPAPVTTPPTTSVPAPTEVGADIVVPTFAADEYDDARQSMVDVQIEGRDVSDATVLAAMRTVPRHRFVPAEFVGAAYNDHPLPIGFGQTISQPYIVALMSEELGAEPGDRVLEIGTGSGYQAAVLGQMGLEVYTIEIIPELAASATSLLADLGYDNVIVRHADGYFGWEEMGQFDGILVTAAPDHVPQPLVKQLAPGAAMVIPVGPIGAVQTLWRFTVDDAGELLGENLGGVSFVPLTRAENG